MVSVRPDQGEVDGGVGWLPSYFNKREAWSCGRRRKERRSEWRKRKKGEKGRREFVNKIRKIYKRKDM